MAEFQLTSSLIAILWLSSLGGSNARGSDDYVGRSSADSIRIKGYLATEYTLHTTDGYLLNLIRASNPLLKVSNLGQTSRRKDPLLFVHGTQTTARAFVASAAEAQPRDLSQVNASRATRADLERLLLPDPSSRSLVFLALNFGHEVWLLNRRGNSESAAHADPSMQPCVDPLTGLGRSCPSSSAAWPDALNLVEFNPKYWNFSLDEQAKYDIPQAVEFVRSKSGRDRVALVGHSSGSALVMMALIVKPELAHSISKGLLWAPSMHIGNAKPDDSPVESISPLVPVIERYKGPIPPLSLTESAKNSRASLCRITQLQLTVCARMIDDLYGPSGGQQRITAAFASLWPDAASSGEIVSLAQTMVGGVSRFFDYGDPTRNMIAYGQTEAPIYDVTKITSRGLSIWVGSTDVLVTAIDMNRLRSNMTDTNPNSRRLEHRKVSVELKYLNESGLYFNHVGFLAHDRVAELINIPALRLLESA